MTTSLVLTFIGEDKPGLVELLSNTVVEHEGNWLESRMSRLEGRFAGILRASVPPERADDLAAALESLASRGLHVRVERSAPAETDRPTRALDLDLIGADRAGIIREISRALSERGVNVEELHTECTSAPMSGELLFRARAKLHVPESSSVAELHAALEEIAADLLVDITLSGVDEEAAG